VSKGFLVTERFAGRRVAVIGAAGGIGAFICESLHRQGAAVYALDVRVPVGLNPAILSFGVDVSSEESVAARFGRLYHEIVNERRGSGEGVPSERLLPARAAEPAV
jgi:NAD(P)-dependent dehydrogenase (short-subunit alcohol dehydrogenase family)